MSSLGVLSRTFLLVALVTGVLAVAALFADVEHVTSIYLIPVLFAAIRGGVLPAVIAALAGIGAAAFFFYPPIYDFRVQSTIQIVDLVLFIFVAVVTGQLATNLRRAKEREEMDTLREALIGSVSHELRTPLASILGSASVLAKTPSIANDAHLSPLVQGLREESERLNSQIENLIDSTRISSEGVRPRPEWIDPGDIVNAAVERKGRLLAGHQVRVSVPDELPLIQIDATMIERALGQLIENAVKYSPRGSRIEIGVHHSGDRVTMAVRDEGMGLTADESDRIWDRFYRGERQRDSTTGSGLGLWIARALVVACGGSVKAESAGPNRGTTVSLELPVQPYDGETRSD